VVEQGAPAQEGDDQRVDTWQVEVIRPRRVGAEQVAQEALRRRGLR
jgi:hypothetical protein